MTMSNREYLRIVTPPGALPVTLEEAKAHLRVDHDVEDAAISGLIAAAVDLLEGPAGFLGRALEPATWDLSLDAFPQHEIQIPLGPVASITSVAFLRPDGAQATVPAAGYALDNLPGFDAWLVPTMPWPATMVAANAVRVRFVAGTGTPAAVKGVILDMVARKYDARGGVRMLSPDLAADLAPYRRPVIE